MQESNIIDSHESVEICTGFILLINCENKRKFLYCFYVKTKKVKITRSKDYNYEYIFQQI